MKVDTLQGSEPAPIGLGDSGGPDDPFGPPPPGAIDFDVEISLPDGEAPPHVSLRFESLDDFRAYQDAVIAHGVGALVRQAMDAAADAQCRPPSAASDAREPSAPSKVGAGRPLPDAKFMKLADYARRTGYSVRTIANLVDQGLPTVGGGRLRRVDVELADEWVRTLEARRRRARDEIEADAQEDARRSRSSRRSGTR